MSRKKLKIIDLYPSELSLNSLPTNQDVIRAIYFEKKSNSKCFKEAMKKVVESIVVIWKRASLPTVQNKTIIDKMQSYHASFLKLSHCETRYKNYNEKVRVFKVIFQLFGNNYSSIKNQNIQVFLFECRKRQQSCSTFLHANVLTSLNAHA